MAILEAENVFFDYGDKPLLSGVELRVNPGEHCALVGINGSGKSTLLKLIIGDIRPDKGSISWQNGVTYTYLDQHLTVDMDQKAEDYFYGVYASLFRKEKEMESLSSNSFCNPKSARSSMDWVFPRRTSISRFASFPPA